MKSSPSKSRGRILSGSRKSVFLLIAVELSLFSSAARAQQRREETVIVTAAATPVPFDNLSRTVRVLTGDELRSLPARSVAEALELAGIDLLARAPLGMQADFSIRGSGFGQVLVMVDGIRINDSQTAHHNGDIPVPLEDVERIEILYGPGSALYGADAMGGIVNIIRRRKYDDRRVSLNAGGFGLLEGSLGLGFEGRSLRQRFSASGSRSSGFTFDRDFRAVEFASQTEFGANSRLTASHLNKEFGADGFYGPSPSREWTDQTLISFERRLRPGKSGEGSLQTYYRTHGDRFLYDIRTPGLYENLHRTHAAGARIKTGWALSEKSRLSLGGEAGADAIVSSNLGDHAFGRGSAFAELQWKPAKTAAVYSGFRYDYYSNFGSSVSPSLSASWWAASRVRLRSSVAHSYRIPTFTELYYRDPNHEAQPSLSPERAWGGEVGADVVLRPNLMGSATLFARRERNVIDWIRGDPSEKWVTANMRKLRTRGAELGLDGTLGSSTRFGVHYGYLDSDAGAISYESKYVLDYARHSVTATGSAALPLSFTYGQTVSWRRRSDGRSYVLVDGRLSRRFRKFTARLDLSNLLDTEYQEIKGIEMPGRWIIFGLEFAR